MKHFTLLLSFAAMSVAMAQNYRYGLPSESFFPAFSPQHTSFSLLPSLSYNINSRGNLFNSGNYENPNVSEFLKTLLKDEKSRNYLSFNLQASLFDFHRKTKKGEIGFGIGLKSAGVLLSKISYPATPSHFDTAQLMFTPASPNIRVRINTYAAVSYSFSFLKHVNKKHLQNYGFKLELLTGLNAIKASFKSDEIQFKDTNNINMMIRRKGFIGRSKNKLFPEELLPFYRNPGIAVSYGSKWQLSVKNRLSVNITDLGFIYFSRTNNYLHRSSDTLNLKSERNPFTVYSDSLKSYSKDHNEAYYFLPFNLNIFFEHQIDRKHTLIMMANYNPILRNSKFSVLFNQHIGSFMLTPSLHLVNFNNVCSGFGIMKQSKYITWAVNIDYLTSTLILYQNTWQQQLVLNDVNNFQTAFHVYYHLIKRTTRQNSRNHKLIRTYVKN